MNIQEEINKLVFRPETRHMSAGNEIQHCSTEYLNVGVTCVTYFPFNILINIYTWYIVDLVLPMDTKVEKGKMSACYYTDAGYGLPVFDELEDVIAFINKFKGIN
jgi:hypothetical protein